MTSPPFTLYRHKEDLSKCFPIMLMPSAHVPIFCRKELREKVGVKVRFFLGLSQRRRPIFCHKQLWGKNRTDFFWDLKSAHKDWFFIGAIVCDINRRGPIVGWRHSDYFLGLKSAHTDRFFVVSRSKKTSERFFIGAKVSAHDKIFTPIFCRPYALDISSKPKATTACL